MKTIKNVRKEGIVDSARSKSETVVVFCVSYVYNTPITTTTTTSGLIYDDDGDDGATMAMTMNRTGHVG